MTTLQYLNTGGKNSVLITEAFLSYVESLTDVSRGETGACGGSLDGGREKLCESCWRRSSNRWTVASSAATRASRARTYSWTATGVCSHSSGGKGGMVFIGLDHTRLGTGEQVSHTTAA